MYTRLKRGPTDKVKEHVGPEGSIVLDTDLKNLRLQDGTTRGGVVTLDNGISISGVELPLFRDTEYHLTITNYDSFSDYGVVVDRGTASLEGSVITLVTPWDSEIIHLDIFKNGVGKRLTVPVEVPEPWSTFNVLTPAPVEMQNVTAAADEELIYVVVRSPTENQGTFWSYNILTDTWTELPRVLNLEILLYVLSEMVSSLSLTTPIT